MFTDLAELGAFNRCQHEKLPKHRQVGISQGRVRWLFGWQGLPN